MENQKNVEYKKVQWNFHFKFNNKKIKQIQDVDFSF